MILNHFCVFIAFWPLVFGFFKTDIFPFGPDIGDIQLDTQDDISSSELYLDTPIIFYETPHSSVYINSNGLISFYTDIPVFYNIQFPMDYPIIAPFYADIDITGTGKVFYRETSSQYLLDRANNYIQEHFTTAAAFRARSLLIVTWEEVGSYKQKTEKKNTFQLVIASDGHSSYALFLYVDIQWIYYDGKGSNLPQMRAQAGFMSGESRTTLLPGSGTDQIRNIHKISNIGDKGFWLFHIGTNGLVGNLNTADLNIGESAISSQVPQTCSIGTSFCHINAKCTDYNPGYCCECDDGFYGNGKNCLKREEPLRLNGKVSGTLNDIKFEDADLHSYVVPSEGRAYTAISRIDETLGYDMQTLMSLGVTVGWLFATSSHDLPNGYHITGGILNNTLTVEFPQTGHKVTMEQNYLGLDVFNSMRATVTIHGTTPSIPFEKRIEVDDFSEEYTRTSPGTIRSHSTHNYHLEETSINIPFIVDQTVTFDECSFAPIDSEEDQATSLEVSRNYIVYDAREKLLRYAVVASVEPLSSGSNPCDLGKEQCGRHSSCVVEGDGFSCLCNPGFEEFYENVNGETATCVDIDECQQRRDNCHVNAECFNYEGSFSCRCKQGFNGDGISCIQLSSCDVLRCEENAECVHLPGQSAQCQCKPGFIGDGVVCRPQFDENEDCSENMEMCDLNADCIYNPQSGKHECQCLEGLIGNGLTCAEEIESCDILNNCHPDASCVYEEPLQQHYCVCNANFRGDGYTVCDPIDPNENEESCNLINNCHHNALCVYDSRHDAFVCRCTAGFEGDGYTCAPSDVTCDSLSICSTYAKCVKDEATDKFQCRCLEGYSGDGILCLPPDECNSIDDCSPNAQCVYDHIGQRHHCQCDQGYAGTGKECSLQAADSCDVHNNCHPEAQCNYDGLTLSWVCICNPGFTGDGHYCEPAVTSCNLLNTCHPNAVCAFDENERAYRCQCHQGYNGDGLDCVPDRSCRNDPSMCDANAECIVHPSLHQYVCQCLDGYFGDGSGCSVIQSYEGNFLLVNQGMATVRMPLDSSKGLSSIPVSLVPYQTALGIDVDCAAGQFYWTDVSGSTIMRAAYNGSDPNPFINTNIISPESVAVDWVSRNVFWTDSGKDTIEVARIDTKERKVLFDTDLSNPRGITLHPGRGKIYWTDWDRDSPKIEQSNMDGTNREVFVSENLGLPNLLTVDYDREDLCWADAGVQKIECISLHGHNRRTVIAPVAYPFGIANNRDTLFWTDWETNTINSASKVGYSINKPIKSPLGTHSKVYGIVYVPDTCPRVSNVCALNNGGCKSLCLANGHGGRTCACADEGDKEELDECNEIR
uniref:Nidogen n=1 Tax=Strigamia maritima TaxID=126957 RepID=T1JGD6_STRMM